jgi:putative FmdB family regulatory protein
MPIYLYQCDRCGIRFERSQRFSDAPLTQCPECEGHVHRVIQPASVVFKGSGFYVTDNRQVSSPTLSTRKETDKAHEPGSTPSEAPAESPSPQKEKPAEDPG